MIFANLVSYDGTNVAWNTAEFVEFVFGGISVAVAAAVVLLLMLWGARSIFRAIRGDGSDYVYGSDEEIYTGEPLPPSGLADFQMTEKAMAYYVGAYKPGKSDMYLWDGEHNMGTLAGPKGPLP